MSALHFPVKADIPQLRVLRRLCPCVLARNAEHRRDGVIPEGNERPLVLPARAGDVDVALNEGIGVQIVNHSGTSHCFNEETRRMADGLRKG